MDYNSKPFPVMTIDGLHYIKSVIVSDDPYELTILCDTSWEGEVFEVPATVFHQGRKYTVTGIDVGHCWHLQNLGELRIPPTVRHIFPEACVGIKSLQKVNIPDHCRVYSGAFAQCGIEELILGEYVLLEEGCFFGIRAKQVNIPDTTKWSTWQRDDYESDSCFEFFPVSADSMEKMIRFVFRNSLWHHMELLKHVRKGEYWAVEALADSAVGALISADIDGSYHNYPFSLDEILSLMDEDEKHLISQFKENQERIMNMNSSDDDLPF